MEKAEGTMLSEGDNAHCHGFATLAKKVYS